MSEPGWNPESEPFRDYLEGSAYLADEPASARTCICRRRATHPRGGLQRDGQSRTATAEAGAHALSTPPTPPSQGGVAFRRTHLLVRRIVSLLRTAAHGAVVVTWQVIVLARRFPRASLASGLSVAILAAVLVLKPGKGEHDTTAQIGNNHISNSNSKTKPKSNPPAQTAQNQPPPAPPASQPDPKAKNWSRFPNTCHTRPGGCRWPGREVE